MTPSAELDHNAATAPSQARHAAVERSSASAGDVVARPEPTPAIASIVAHGALSNPRAVAVTDAGVVYVADAGVGAEPYSGQIVRVAPDGSVTPLVVGIGNSVGAPGDEHYLFGLSDVVVSGSDVDVVLGTGAWLRQPLHGPNRVMRVGASRPIEEVFDLGTLEAERDPDGQGIDSNAAGVAAAPDGTLWVTDAAGNWVAHLTQDGVVLAVVAFPMVDGEQAVPTGVAVGPDGAAYVTLFRCQQPTQGKGGVARVSPDGTFEIAVSGLSNPIDVAFDARGNMYVLEFAVDYAPETGRVLRVGDDGATTAIIDGLTFPTSLAIDAQGSIYVTEISAVSGGAAGSGKLLRFDRAGS